MVEKEGDNKILSLVCYSFQMLLRKNIIFLKWVGSWVEVTPSNQRFGGSTPGRFPKITPILCNPKHAVIYFVMIILKSCFPDKF